MRAFVAVEITDAQLVSAIARIQGRLGTGRPVSAKNLHFTLQFLGEISEATCKSVQTALGRVSFEPFILSCMGIGAFPGPRAPRVVWVGTDESGEKLTDLAGMVEEALLPLGFKNDRPFKPHLTVSRIKSGAVDITGDLAEFEGMKLGRQEIRRIKLKKSVLTSSGPVYSDLEINTAR